MSEADDLHRRGIVAFERGSFEAALSILEQAVKVDPARIDILSDLAVVAHNFGDRAKAETCFRAALLRMPDAARLNFNFANLLKDQARWDEALDHYRRSVAGEPSFAPAHNNLGNVLKELKRWDEAAESFRAAIAADPNFAPAHRNLADINEIKSRTEAAILGFQRAASLRGDAGARIRAALAMPVIAPSTAEIEDVRERITRQLAELRDAGLRLDDPLRQVGATPFHLAYHGHDDRPIVEALAALYRDICPSLSFTAPHCEKWLPGMEGGPIRIGFVSTFLHDHTIARLNEALIAKLPRDRFDVHVFDRLPRDLAAARAILAAAQLDILYYTDIGMEPLTYFLAFARLAPIQCVTWGHPVTTGIPTIDYFISGAMIEAQGAQEFYTERLIELDAMPDVAVPDAPRDVTKGPVFLCPQSLFKLHPDFDSLIGRILTQCPGTEMAVLAGNHAEWEHALRLRWANTIPAVADRIRFVPRRARDEFTGLLASARVSLDTPHFCGGLTSLETLATGVPVVTLPSRFVRARLTSGLYSIMGMDDLVADDGDTYVNLAVRLARDDTFHAAMRDKVRDLSPHIVRNPATIEEHVRFFERAVYGEV